MTMNWGHGIIAAFALFVGYILYLVTGCLNEEVGLVADDYYAQEVAYQDRIDHTNNARAVKNDITIVHNANQVIIEFPEEWQKVLEQGEVHFFRPSDQSLDLKLPLSLDGNGQFRVNSGSFKSGRYEVKLSWTTEGKGYYVAKDLFI